MEGIQALKRASELNSNYDLPWVELGWAYTELGKYDQALEAFDHVQDRESNYLLFNMCDAYYAMGNISESNVILEKLIENDGEADNSWAIATAFAQRGEADQCFEWLQRACERKTPSLCFLKVGFKRIEDLQDPRYEEFLVKLNFPVD